MYTLFKKLDTLFFRFTYLDYKDQIISVQNALKD